MSADTIVDHPAEPDPGSPHLPGHIFLLPGIEGSMAPVQGMINGLREAGVSQAVHVVEWDSRTIPWLSNLIDFEANVRHARNIAEQIENILHNDPDCPVVLIGLSGGGGLAIMVCEALSPNVSLDRVALVGAAISPDRALDAVLERSRQGVVSFYSKLDCFMLGVGTMVFGTIDRRHVVAAGCTGLRDADGEMLAAENIVQVGWRPSWCAMGHYGGHVGWLAQGWAREVLAQYVQPNGDGCVLSATTGALAAEPSAG